jgi:K+-sensing histidine kinase KdpD
MQRRSFVGGSAMVWGGKTERDRTILVVVAGNLTEIRYQGELIQRFLINVLNNACCILFHIRINAGPISTNVTG